MLTLGVNITRKKLLPLALEESWAEYPSFVSTVLTTSLNKLFEGTMAKLSVSGCTEPEEVLHGFSSLLTSIKQRIGIDLTVVERPDIVLAVEPVAN